MPSGVQRNARFKISPERRVLLRLHHAMHAGHANVALAPGAHRVGDGRQRRPQIQDADADAEDVDSFVIYDLRIYDLRFASQVHAARKIVFHIAKFS